MPIGFLRVISLKPAWSLDHPRLRGASLQCPLVGLLWLCGYLSVDALAADLSQYRSFRLGMDMPSVAKLAGINPSEVKVLYSKPARVEELAWYPNLGAGPEGRPDPIHSTVFSFYDGSLYNILVTYDDSKTQGLTTQDLTEALNPVFGIPAHPAGNATVSVDGMLDNGAIMAQWENADGLVRLLRLSYRDRIAMTITSKRVSALAARAIEAAQQLDAAQAPERDAARRRAELADQKKAEAKAREVNKPNFRP